MFSGHLIKHLFILTCSSVCFLSSLPHSPSQTYSWPLRSSWLQTLGEKALSQDLRLPICKRGQWHVPPVGRGVVKATPLRLIAVRATLSPSQGETMRDDLHVSSIVWPPASLSSTRSHPYFTLEKQRLGVGLGQAQRGPNTSGDQAPKVV